MIDGVSLCARYAFGPNRLHLCGPDANSEVLAYLHEGMSDSGLTRLLTQFKTLYPYLETIARANYIPDPFDARVVEAYWLGNPLLESVDASKLYRHFTDSLCLKKMVPAKSFHALEDKLRYRPAPQHNFHVFNVWKRTGFLEEHHTLQSLDQCRISWGKIIAVDGPFLTVERKPLVFNRKLTLGPAQHARIIRNLEDHTFTEDVVVGDTISIHWGVPCEILSQHRLASLKYYTQQSLALANLALP